ncbi:hypothetical protein [Bradyrhizobium sp. Bra64]|uniref:hypothetical protein n=1 Tax=Bradyrhizobium sp. Bra64 TaxID=2926009 RepID=UPI0021181C2A|nr:hypothetical protein [Bradyrhizobium sp. Bra64]
MKIPKPTELHPLIAELETKRNALHAKKTAKVAEAAAIRSRVQESPSNGNAAENKVRAILGEPLLPDSAPDMPRLEALLLELNTLNTALGQLDSKIQKERNIGSRLVCEATRPEVTKRAKAFANALLAFHAAHLEYDRYFDEIENTGTNVSSLNRVFLTHIGSPRDPCGGYHYSLRDFVDAGIISRSDMPQVIR